MGVEETSVRNERSGNEQRWPRASEQPAARARGARSGAAAAHDAASSIALNASRTRWLELSLTSLREDQLPPILRADSELEPASVTSNAQQLVPIQLRKKPRVTLVLTSCSDLASISLTLIIILVVY